MPEIYKLHRLALLPFISENNEQALATVYTAISSSSAEDTFVRFILQQGLGGFWFNALKETSSAPFPPAFVTKLKDAAYRNAVNYLQQQCTLKNIEKLFEDHSIRHAVMKGAHIREVLYEQPAIRPACDIDILIAENEKTQVIKALIAYGMELQPEARNISHEISLTKNNVSLDLHWNLLRPGRIRTNLTDEFLQNRMDYSGRYGLCSEATLFLMLVHPVFTKYATAPQSSLMRIVDLMCWIKQREIDWQKLQDWLKKGGVQSSAWITAEWLTLLTGFRLPEPFMQKIKPGKFRSAYLRKWLSDDYSSALQRYPILIQAGLTLPAHDRFADAFRAISTLVKEKRVAPQKLLQLQKECL